MNNGEEFIAYSMRSNWGHLYLYDGRTGKLKNAITQGDWAVRDVVRVDAAHRWIYFYASGREPGHDPYYKHLYRVRFDGTGLILLVVGNLCRRCSVRTYACAEFRGGPLRQCWRSAMSQVKTSAWRWRSTAPALYCRHFA